MVGGGVVGGKGGAGGGEGGGEQSRLAPSKWIVTSSSASAVLMSISFHAVPAVTANVREAVASFSSEQIVGPRRFEQTRCWS